MRFWKKRIVGIEAFVLAPLERAARMLKLIQVSKMREIPFLKFL